MGFYIRKRARLFPGIWLNLGKSGLSLSAGIGMFRYHQRLTDSKQQKLPQSYKPVPEPTTAQYIGCAIYILGIFILIIGLFAGFGITGLHIFIGCIAAGSILQIVGKDKTPILKVVQVTDENSLTAAVNNLNAILVRMEDAKDITILADTYQKAREQINLLPPTLQLNGGTLEEAKALIMERYAELLKSINKQ